MKTVVEMPLFLLSIPFAIVPPWKRAGWLDPVQKTFSVRAKAACCRGNRRNSNNEAIHTDTDYDDPSTSSVSF